MQYCIDYILDRTNYSNGAHYEQVVSRQQRNLRMIKATISQDY